MTTDPGDLVLDPTCGSGTTAYVAEQWGRRWITIDTSRVALALARARIMGARYPYYLLADSPARAAQGGRGQPRAAEGDADARRYPPGLCLRAGAAHHPEIDRQQCRDRRDLGEVRLRQRFEPSSADPLNYALLRARDAWAGMGNLRAKAQTARSWSAGRGKEAAHRLVGSADRTAEGNRCLDRRQGGVRVPLRQALSRQFAHPRRRPVHGREPVAASRDGRR